MIPEWVKVGVSFDVKFGNSNDALWHIRGIVDDMAVCRRWSANKNRWQYEVYDETFFLVYAHHIVVRKTGGA